MNKPDELIPINLWISERAYRILVKKEDEEAIRKAVKIADNKINELRQNFAGKDDQDFVAMALIMYATDQVTEPERLNPVAEEKLKNLIHQVDNLLD